MTRGDDTSGEPRYSRPVLAIRRLLARRGVAMLLCAATLLLKLLVPTGYMIGGDGGRVTLELCSGMASQPMAMAMPGAAPGAHDAAPGHRESEGGGKTEVPCVFSGLSAASLAAADPIQLAALVAFVMAIGLSAAAAPRMVRRFHLRPPLRGPPAFL